MSSDARDRFVDMMSKVNWEGGWESMHHYGSLPGGDYFPKIKAAYDDFRESYNRLISAVDEVQRELNVSEEEYEA